MDALTQRYQQELTKTRLATQHAVTEIWNRLGSYRDYDIPMFISRTQPIVQAGQSRAVGLTAAFTSQRLGVAPVAISVDQVRMQVRNGLPADQVYRRPFITTWSSLSDEEPLDRAVSNGAVRAGSISAMDVLLASTAAMAIYGFMSSKSDTARVYGWVRESAADCCDYCDMLDGVVTGPSEPMPVHNNCNCTASPLSSRTDLKDALSSSHSAMADRENITAIEQHGELGAVITKRGENFYSPLQQAHDARERIEILDVPKDTKVAAMRLYNESLAGGNSARMDALRGELMDLPGGLNAMQVINV
jgi:hypothetical protein